MLSFQGFRHLVPHQGFPGLSHSGLFFFNYLTVSQPTLYYYHRDSLTDPMLITVFVHIQPEGHREPRNEVGSLSPAERLVGFEPGTFQFWL